MAAGIAFSRGPRALSLPSELIIYSIYKTLYVQNRKICKEIKEEDVLESNSFVLLRNQLWFICLLNAISSVHAPKGDMPSLLFLLGICAVCTTNCSLHNHEYWLPSWSLQRYAAGLVTEQLCRKTRSRREIDPVSSYKQHRPGEHEATQTLRSLNLFRPANCKMYYSGYLRYSAIIVTSLL